MNLEKLNTWLSLLANIGVLAGIVFLAIEISQSNRQAQSETFQARINEIDQSQREYALSDVLPELYVKISQSGVESLSPVELERVSNWELATITRLNGQFIQYQQGFLNIGSYNEMLIVGSGRLSLWKELGISTVFEELIKTLEREAEKNSYGEATHNKQINQGQG
jgi:hypothetical protein